MNNFYKISEAMKYIDTHLNDVLSVQMIAEQFAFSPYYFHRLFTSIVGKSLMAYVRDRRIAYACKMLNETERKVLDIALDFGFDSAQSFSRTFKSITGMSPTKYRSRKLVPCIVPAAELVKQFTNRLKGGILMNPNMIKKEKIILAGVSGFGNETAEIWKRFMKLYKEVPLTDKISDDSYEVRIYDSAAEKESVFVGCEINSGCDGYESENDAMEEWLVSNEKGYVRNLLEGKPYCIEHYDARFDADNGESIVEIWLPIKKARIERT